MGCNNDILSFIIFIAVILCIAWIWTIMRRRKQQRQYARAMAKANADGIQMTNMNGIPMARQVARQVTGQGEGGEGIMDF